MGNKLFNRDMKTQIAVIYFCIYFGITLLPTTLSMAAFNLTPASVEVHAMAVCMVKCEERTFMQTDSACTVELQAIVR